MVQCLLALSVVVHTAHRRLLHALLLSPSHCVDVASLWVAIIIFGVRANPCEGGSGFCESWLWAKESGGFCEARRSGQEVQDLNSRCPQ